MAITKLNLVPSGVMPVVYANQYDVNVSRTFEIYSGDVAFPIPEGWSITCRGTKPDGYGVIAPVDYAAGSSQLVVSLTEQMTAAPGDGTYELRFAGRGVNVGTLNFILRVERAALNDDTVISDTDISYMERVLDEIQDLEALEVQIRDNTNSIREVDGRITAEVATLDTRIDGADASIAEHTSGLTSLTERVAEAETDIAAESARIDAIVALPDGSTTADAELVDIRVGENSQVYASAGDAVREQIEDVYHAMDALATYGREGLSPAWTGVYIGTDGVEHASTTRSTTALIDSVAGMRIVNNGSQIVYVGCYGAGGTWGERRSISAGSGLTLTAAFVGSYPQFRVSIYNSMADLVFITGPKTLATADEVGRNGANHALDPAAGAYLTFAQSFRSPNYAITVDLSDRTSAMLVTDPSGGTGSIGALNWPIVVNHGEVLVYNIATQAVEVYTVAQLAAVKDPYLILLKNHYGRPKGGDWYRLFLAWQLRQLDTGAGFAPYYAEHIDSKARLINRTRADAGATGDSFIFVTDTHWHANLKNSPGLIKYLLDHTTITTVIHGGDVVVSSVVGDDVIVGEVLDERARFSLPNADVYRVIGNHDIHGEEQASIHLSHWDCAAYMTADLARKPEVHFGSREDSYYYFDHEDPKIRYIVLNTHTVTGEYIFPAAESQWLAETLLAMPEGYSAYIIAHCALTPVLNEAHGEAYVDALGVVNACASGGSYTVGGETYTFPAGGRRIIAVHCGHYHKDLMQKVDGVWHVATAADAPYEDSGYLRTAGTIAEQAFDVVTINQATKTVTLERIGGGYTRTFTYD